MKEEERNTWNEGRKETNTNNIRKIRKTKRRGRHRTAENKHKNEAGYEENPPTENMITRRRHKLQNR